MKVLNSIQRLGNIGNTAIFIDWKYLASGHGKRQEIELLQITLGKLLKGLTIFTILLIVFLDILNGSFSLNQYIFVDRLTDLFFWISIFLFCYSRYLLRDRTVFLDTLEIKSLEKLRVLEQEGKLPEEIELADYMDFDFLSVLDDYINTQDRDFLIKFIYKLVEFKKVKVLLSRLGLTSNSLEEVLKKTYLDINTSRDTWLSRLIWGAFIVAFNNGFESIDEEAVMLYILAVPLKEPLIDYEILPNEVSGLLIWARNEAKKRRYKKLWRERASLKPQNSVNRAYTSRLAKTLEQFKRDFTFEVLRGEFILSIARESEMNETLRLLQQGGKGAVLLVGDPGVGKTNFLKSIALRMVVEDVPKELTDKRLVGFDFTRAYATSKNINEFENKLRTVLEEVKETKNIILVFDDFDQLINLRQEVAGEVINLLVKSIDEFDLRIIATTTNEGYISSIKPNKALVSLFDVVTINEPNDDISTQILIDVVPDIEKKTGIKISSQVIRKVVSLSRKFAFDRQMPSKAIDLLEEAATYARENKLTFVSEVDVEKLVSKKVGVSIGAISDEERSKLIQIEDEMHKRVIGQHAAVTAIASALKRARAGLTSANRPVASFLFFGPTGVGKTEVAKTLAATYYGDEKFMVRIDMSEYHEEDNLKRLIGYREGDDFFGGALTEAVREKPYSLLLLDEIEKANRKVLDLFLQILDEGIVTDGMGRKVDFRNTIIIATSNVGSKKIAELIEAGNDYNKVNSEVINDLRSEFRVEFLNRFDKVIMFKPLLQSEIEQIAGIFVEKVSKNLYDKGIIMDYNDQLLKELSTIAFNPVYGAREMRRIIQDQLESKIADLILEGKLGAGKKIIFSSLENFEIFD